MQIVGLLPEISTQEWARHFLSENTERKPVNREDAWRALEKENWLRKRETGKKRCKRKLTVIKPTISKLQNRAKVWGHYWLWE